MCTTHSWHETIIRISYYKPRPGIELLSFHLNSRDLNSGHFTDWATAAMACSSLLKMLQYHPNVHLVIEVSKPYGSVFFCVLTFKLSFQRKWLHLDRTSFSFVSKVFFFSLSLFSFEQFEMIDQKRWSGGERRERRERGSGPLGQRNAATTRHQKRDRFNKTLSPLWG